MLSENPRLFDFPGANEAFGERLDKVLALTEVSQQRLASLANVTPKTVYGWTRGVIPFKANMRSIERATGFSSSFFGSQSPASEVMGLNYWARNTAPKYIRARFAAFAFMVGEVINHIAPDVPLPEVALRKLASRFSSDPEAAAAEVRRAQKLGEGPIDPLALAESLGVVLVFGPPEIFDVDAFSAWVDNTPMIVLNPERAEPFRLWHTVAHELGHLFMHDREQGTELRNSPDREDDAEQFATHLLMPNVASFNEGLQRAVRTYGWEALTRLSDRFRVSIKDLITSAKKRGLERQTYLDERAVRLNLEGADLHYSDKTPYVGDLTTLSERVEELGKLRRYTVRELAAEIGIPDRYVALMSARTMQEATDFDRRDPAA